MANYWLKLYHETLHDPKMGRLPDRLYRRTVEIFLSAGENNNAGSLPPTDDLAWVLRLTEEELEADLVELSKSEIVHKDGDHWVVTNFTKRQKADSDAKRKEEQRKRDRIENQDVTNCDDVVTENVQDIDIDTELDTELDTDIDVDVDTNYQVIRLAYINEFPDKPKPRHINKSHTGRVRTRMKAAHFKDNWIPALERAGRSDLLHQSGWFDLGWFLKNDDNYSKCLNGNYDNNSRAPARASPDPMAEYHELVARKGWDKEQEP